MSSSPSTYLTRILHSDQQFSTWGTRNTIVEGTDAWWEHSKFSSVTLNLIFKKVKSRSIAISMHYLSGTFQGDKKVLWRPLAELRPLVWLGLIKLGWYAGNNSHSTYQVHCVLNKHLTVVFDGKQKILFFIWKK